MMLCAFGEFLMERAPELWVRTGEHLFLTGVAVTGAIVTGIPLGVLGHGVRWLRRPLLGVLGTVQTIPSLAMLTILLSLLHKIGTVPAVIALWLYALLPIVRNAVTGLEGVSPEVIEAARGVGMTERQQLWMVKIPLAVPMIVAGIRTAAVISVGIATLSAFIGAGGLGEFINRGLQLNNKALLLLGAIPAAILALLVDFAIGAAVWGLRPIRQNDRGTLKAKLRPFGLAAPLLLVALGVITTVTQLGPARARTDSTFGESPTICIGCKGFTEQFILGELMGQLIEQRTNLNVRRQFGLGGTMICHAALENGQIDLYAEYSGTGYRVILRQEGLRDPEQILLVVTDSYREKYNAEWLDPFGFNNTYAIAVRSADAERKGWKKISDLAKFAGDLRAGFTSEFQEREDGYPGLRKAYGFGFGEARDLDPALMYEALATNEVDVICAFATDGRIAAYDLKTLTDDRGFFPPYHAAPVVRTEILQRHPEIREALAPLRGLLDDETMRRLNYEVDEKKRSPAEVAREFLRANNLTK